MPAPAGVAADPAAGAGTGMPHLLYLNFSDGTDTIVRAASDRSRENASAILAADPYPAFKWEAFVSTGASRDEVIRTVTRRVHQAFLPYNVLVSTARPTPPETYAMVMIGGGASAFGLPSDVAGIAIMDCANRQEGNIVYAFPANIRGDAHTLFVTIAQEAAHSYGLEHTNDPADLMYPRAVPTQKSFVDLENAISGSKSCGSAVQNSHQRLLQILGAWPGGEKPLLDGAREDVEPPTVRIDEPAAGTEVGGTFLVRAVAYDDVRIDHVVLEAGSERMMLTEPPWQWALSHFPSGPLTVSVTAVDGAGRTGSASVVVTVGRADSQAGCSTGAPDRTARPGLGAAALVGAVALACARRRRRL